MPYETDPLCRYEMRLGLAKEYPSDLIGKIWKHERRAGINLENKETHWTEDRLQSICPVLLPRLPPLVGDECWLKWLGEKRRKTNADKYVGAKNTRENGHISVKALCVDSQSSMKRYMTLRNTTFYGFYDNKINILSQGTGIKLKSNRTKILKIREEEEIQIKCTVHGLLNQILSPQLPCAGGKKHNKPLK